ncbi:hypothetical protein RJ55_03019 [Drechmeria coniospora]|nr:hypothetical protein RJ55_03019 [Drechmeria coniospora]
MASLSRSFELPCRRLCAGATVLPTLPRTTTCRQRFTTSLRLRSAADPSSKQVRARARPPALGDVSPAQGSTAPSRYAFIKSLATKQTPTVLYEAPSHFWFYFGCWSSGLAIITWTALTGPTVVDQPEGVPQWVSVTFGASYVLLGAMGFYLISKTPNIVGSIRILPAATASPSASAAAPRSLSNRAAAAPAAPTASPRLEVTVKRMVPLLAPKVISTSLDGVALKSRFSLPEEYVPELRRLEQEREGKERARQLRKHDMEHLLTMPFRRLGRALVNMFRGVRAAWTDMGYGIIRVDGKEYKVDVAKGFAHDGFRTLERIVTIGWK